MLFRDLIDFSNRNNYFSFDYVVDIQWEIENKRNLAEVGQFLSKSSIIS